MKVRIFFDAEQKKLTSFRDGVQEYYGLEIDQEPHDKVFKVYRSPETVEKASRLMPALTITDEHIPLDTSAKDVSIGTVLTSDIIEAQDAATDTTIAVQNRAVISSEAIEAITNGKRELSLGYRATLNPHAGDYDFTQTDIEPHHLAIVDAGRCGLMCTFNDKDKAMPPEKEEEIVKTDSEKETKPKDEKTPTADNIEELTAKIKALPLEEVQQLAIMVAEIIKANDTPKEGAEPEEKETKDSKCACQSGFKDTDEFKDAINDASKKAVKQYAVVTEKARDFLGGDYEFADKSTDEIMRDAIATQTDEGFQDAEIETAFKMLKKSDADYSNFGDEAPTSWDSLTDKEI